MSLNINVICEGIFLSLFLACSAVGMSINYSFITKDRLKELPWKAVGIGVTWVAV